MFSYEISKIFKNAFLTVHLQWMLLQDTSKTFPTLNVVSLQKQKILCTKSIRPSSKLSTIMNQSKVALKPTPKH